MNLKQTFNSTESRVSFLKGLALLSVADGKVDETEKEYFFNAGIGLEIPEDQLKNIISIFAHDAGEIDTVSVIFENKKQSLLFLREAIQLCYLNGDYCLAERKLVNSFAAQFNINKSGVEKLEKWVIGGIDWSKTGDTLLAELEAQ